MIGKIRVTSITYQQFCRKVRSLVPGISQSRLYREWCLELKRTENTNYEKIAKRLNKSLGNG